MNTIINIIRNFIGGVLVFFAIVGFLPIGDYIIALIIFLLGLLTIPSTNKATILLFKSPKSFIEELPIFSKKINSLLDNDYLYWVKPLFAIVFFAWCASVVFPDGCGSSGGDSTSSNSVSSLGKKATMKQIASSCKGKTRIQVKKLLGKPTSVDDVSWIYHQRAYDPVSETYRTPVIYFRNDKCYKIEDLYGSGVY